MSYNKDKFTVEVDGGKILTITNIVQLKKDSNLIEIIFDNDIPVYDSIKLSIEEMAVCNIDEIPLANRHQTMEKQKNMKGVLTFKDGRPIAPKDRKPYIDKIEVSVDKI